MFPTRPATSTFSSSIHYDRVTGALHTSTSIIRFMLLHSCSNCDVLKIFKVMSLCGWHEVKLILSQQRVVLSRVRDLGYSYDIHGDFHIFNGERAYIVLSALAACITQTHPPPWSHHDSQCFRSLHSTNQIITITKNIPFHEQLRSINPNDSPLSALIARPQGS